MEPTHRLAGIDVARFAALVGMVVVHAQSDLVLPPLERAAAVSTSSPRRRARRSSCCRHC